MTIKYPSEGNAQGRGHDAPRRPIPGGDHVDGVAVVQRLLPCSPACLLFAMGFHLRHHLPSLLYTRIGCQLSTPNSPPCHVCDSTSVAAYSARNRCLSRIRYLPLDEQQESNHALPPAHQATAHAIGRAEGRAEVQSGVPESEGQGGVSGSVV